MVKITKNHKSASAREKSKKKAVGTQLKFASILAIISIIGFLEIVSSNFFNFSFGDYIEFLWLTLMGVGFIIESSPKKIHTKKADETVTDITSLVIGIIAIIAGILSIPQVGINHPVFQATKGVVSVIAIIFIAIQTWIVRK